MKSAQHDPFVSNDSSAPPPWLSEHAAPLAFQTRSVTLHDLLPTTRESTLPFSETSLEVIVSFGSTVLHVAHTTPPRSFCLGESEDGAVVDLEVPFEAVGRKRLPIVRVEGETVLLSIPEGARGRLSNREIKMGLEEVYEQAPLAKDLPRARDVLIGFGMQVEMELPGVTVRVALVDRPPHIPRGMLATWDWAVPGYFGLTFGTFASLMGGMAFFTPALGLTDEDALDQERLLLLSQYLDSAAEREQKQVETPQEERGSDGGKEAKRAQGSEGEAGKDEAPRVNKRAAVRGPQHNQDLQLSQKQAVAEAQVFGLIGLLNSSLAGDPLAPTSVFGRDLTLGSDDSSAQGDMWSDTIGESAGRGGLGVLGDGFGGGDLFGNGLGMGMGDVGTIGGGKGKSGFGMSHGRPGGTHVARSPSVAFVGNTEVSGRIPAHVIQRIVRQNFGRFRMCYERGLGRNPNLEGRVAVRFVIGSDGAVTTTSAGGDIPDAEVKSCVGQAFYGLSFPVPEGGGTVRVTYPLMFSPS